MPIETDRYETVAEQHGIEKIQRDVETPLPDGITEENNMTAYLCREMKVNVFKVAHKGWRVSVYDENDEIERWVNGYFEEEAAAHEAAKVEIMEIKDEI